MNQPTEDRLKRLEEEQRQLKEEVRQLREQRTEEIKAVRVEVASEDVINRLKTLEEDTTVLKEDTTVLKDDVGVLKIEMQGARADILQIRESQADLRDRLIEHSADLKYIKDKQDTHIEILGQIVNISEGHTKRFDRIDTTMATKDDISRLEGIMMQILSRMPKTEGE
jgi:chromosome segregation ATPase